MRWRWLWVIGFLLLEGGVLGGERLREGVPLTAAPYPPGFAMPGFFLDKVPQPGSGVEGKVPKHRLSHEPSSILELTNRISADGALISAFSEGQHLGPRTSWPPTNTTPLPGGIGEVALNPADWKFYIFYNEAGFTNLAFLTFVPKAIPEGLPEWQGVEPDLDLYVSTDSDLTNLAPTVVASAWKGISARGTETVMLSDALPVHYYIGVKTEAPVESEFALLVAAKEEPFSRQEPDGSILMTGFPLPSELNDATASGPGVSYAMAISADAGVADRMIVSNTVSHARLSDLRGSLAHEGINVGLNQATYGMSGTRVFAWDDSGLGGPGTEHTHGPGSLLDYSGHALAGQWLLTMRDVATGTGGTNLEFSVQAYPSLTGPINTEVPPGTQQARTIIVPEAATNLAVQASLILGQSTVTVQLCKAGGTNAACEQGLLTPESPTLKLDWDKFASPPLNAGEYVIRLLNEGPETAFVQVDVNCFLDLNSKSPEHALSLDYVSIADDATTVSTMTVTNQGLLVSLNAGVRIQHPRISDLEIRLEAPDGMSALLSSFRGGNSLDGMGLDTTVTNTQPVDSSGGPQASTNAMQVGTGPGTVSIDYFFFELPDTLRVYRGNELIFNSGMTSGSGTWLVSYGFDPTGLLTVVLNEGDNYDTNTAWYYEVTTTRPGMILTTFTESTNLASSPIKFAVPPFTNVTASTGLGSLSNLIAYFPEQSLKVFREKSVQGEWRLHVRDAHAGPASSPAEPLLIAWDLHFILQDPTPFAFPLSHASARTNMVKSQQWAMYSVDVPSWARAATNQLLFSSGPVSVWFAEASPPLGTNAGDVRVIQGATSATAVLLTNGTPSLQPGKRYYLAIQNTNSYAVNSAVKVTFDVTPITPDQPIPVLLTASNTAKYFSFEPSTGSAAVTLQLANVVGNPELVLRRGLPLPTVDSFDYASLRPESESEEIIISRESTPVALGPGVWHVGVINGSPAAAAGGDLLLFENAGATRISRIVATAGYVRLEWSGPPRSRYEVQATTTLNSPSWTTFTGVVTSDTDRFIFQDAPPQGSAKYYRVTRLW